MNIERYIVNRFIRIIKTGFDSYFIKHGILSNKSYVLEFEAETMNRVQLLDDLVKEQGIDIEALAENGKYGDIAEFVQFLLEEKIIVPQNQGLPLMYYSLLANKGKFFEELEGKVLILVSSEEMKRILEFHLENINFEYDVLVGKEYEKAILNEYKYISVIYDFFAPHVFHELNEKAQLGDIPLQISYLDGSTVIISPVFIHNMTVCYNEMEIQLESSLVHNAEYRAYLASMAEKEWSAFPYMRYIPSMAVFYSLHLYFDFLVTGKLKTKDRAIIFDIENLRYDLVDLLPLPNCPACKSHNKMTHDFL